MNETAYFSAEEIARFNIQNLPDLIEGALKMGGKVTQDYTLYAGAGHRNTFLFKIHKYDPLTEEYQDQMTIEHKDNEISAKEKDMVKFTLDNINGIYSSVRHIKGLAFRAKEPNIQVQESVHVTFNLDMIDFNRISVNLSKVSINSLNFGESTSKFPSNISNILILSSDGLRLFYNNGLLDISDIATELVGQLNKLENQLTKIFNTSSKIVLNQSWVYSTLVDLEPLYHLYDIGSMKRMGSERPVVGYLFSQKDIISNIFENVTSDTVKGLLNAGASARLDISLDTVWDHNLNLTISDGFLFKGYTPINNTGSIGNTFVLSPAQASELMIVSTNAARYHSSKANVSVVIDVHEIDILSFTEYLASIDIDAEGILHYVKMEPDSKFARALPKRMSLEYFNSDVMRLMYTEKLLTLEDIEESVYSIIRENISKMLEEDTKMKVNFNENLLEFDSDILHMDHNEPVTFDIHSSGKMRITGERSVRMGGFITKQLELPLPGVKYWNVTYKLLLPKYINVLGQPRVGNSTVEYSAPIVNQGSDGRDELRVTIYGESKEGYKDEVLEINIKVDIDITLWFFLSKIIIPIGLFTILILVIVVLKLFYRYKVKKIDELLSDPEVVIEEEDYSSSMRGRSYKTPKRGAIEKERHIREIDVDSTSSTDYKEQLSDIMPRGVIKKKGKYRSWGNRKTRTSKTKPKPVGRRSKAGHAGTKRRRRH